MYTNPSGEQVWRVEGRLPDGIRVRNNFPERAAAVSCKVELEVDSLTRSTAVGLKRTRLTDEELAEAEAAVRRLAGQPYTLDLAVDFLLHHYRPDVLPKSVEAAYGEFIAQKRLQNLRPDSLRALESRVGALAKRFGHRTVNDLTVPDLNEVINHNGPSPKTILNRRRTLFTFFCWCAKQNYVAANLVAKIDPPKVQHEEPQALSLPEVRALLSAAMRHKKGRLVPVVAAALFAGLRQAELRRIKWADIDLAAKTLTVKGEAAKLRSRRVIDLTDNLVTWLLPFQNRPLFPVNWRRDLDTVRRTAGFRGAQPKVVDETLKPWPASALRHTAISYWQAHFRDEGACAERHGNSVQIIHRHYRALVKAQDAELFWRLTRENVAAVQVILMPVAAA